jgi:STE24 endopeptidase
MVVWDTLLDKATPDEVLFIFGHESGHYVLGHIIIGVAAGIVGLFFAFYIGFRFVRWALARFGTRWRIPSQDDWGALAILLLAFSILSAIAEPIDNGISRSIEHAADVYGQEAIHGIVANPQRVGKEAMAVLGENYLEEPNTPPWVEFWLDNHPSTGRRAAFAAHYDPWAPNANPKYFNK